MVRVAQGDDAEAALALHRRVLAEDRWFITAGDEFHATLDWQRQRIGDFTGRDNSLFLVAFLDKQLVGLLTLDGGRLRRLKHVARLEILVGDEARGQGVGRALMELCIEWSRANRELLKLSLAVFADNTRAVRLYRSLGFVDEGRRAAEYRECDGLLRDDLLLALPV